MLREGGVRLDRCGGRAGDQGATAADFEQLGARVDVLEADLATIKGVDKLCGIIGDRKVDALLANAGRGLGKAFLDQHFDDVMHVVDTNITGTIYLIHRFGQGMRSRGEGKILIVGSIAGFIPGTYQAVYNATKAFLDSFSQAAAVMVHFPSGLFGYSHIMGGFAGGQAEYIRVPFADVGPIKIPEGCQTSRCSSSRTYSRPATWSPKMPASNEGTPLQCEAVGLSPSSPCRAHGCSGRAA